MNNTEARATPYRALTDILRARTPGRWRDTGDDEYVAVHTGDPEDYIIIGTPNEQDWADARAIAVSVNLAEPLLAVAEALMPFAALDDEGLDRSLASGMGTAGGTITWEMLDAARSALATLEAKATEEVG